MVPVTLWAAVKGRNAWLLDLIRSRLWPVPAMGVVTAAATGFLLPYFEGRLPTRPRRICSAAERPPHAAS